MADEISFGVRLWASVKSGLSWLGVKVLGPILVVLLVIVAVILVSMGFKELQIGGLIGRLLGRNSPQKGSVDVTNTIDPNRVGPDGKLIQPNTPDTKGQTQAVVVPINEPGLLSDPSTISFVPPGDAKPIEVVLPDGVTNKDVDQVVVVSPGNFVVTVHDTSGISVTSLDNLLKKYTP